MIKTSKQCSPLWDNIARRTNDTAKMSIIDIIRLNPLYHKLTNRELKKVAEIIYERKYQTGEYLFERDQPGAAMFIIKSGSISVVKPVSSENELVLANLGPEDFVGELALLDDSPRSASARADEPTEALAFFREDLNRLLDTHPQIASKIFKELAIIIGRRLKITNDQLSCRE
jgi:CRP-like cAMP-binding protein